MPVNLELRLECDINKYAHQVTNLRFYEYEVDKYDYKVMLDVFITELSAFLAHC